MMLLSDLFSFAYVPGWYSQLDELAKLALPEPWCFRNPMYLTKNPDTPILERYIHTVFRKHITSIGLIHSYQTVFLWQKGKKLLSASLYKNSSNRILGYNQVSFLFSNQLFND